MFGIIAAIIGAVAGIGTALINRQSTVETNQQNVQMAQQENAITRQREDTSVQRRAEDLKAAGINPLLAGLGGASAQPGQLIPMQAPQLTGLPDFGELFRDIKEGQNFDAQNAKIKSETALNAQQIKNLKASVKQIKANTENIKNDTLLKIANTKIAEKDVMLKEAQTKIATEQLEEVKANVALAYQNADAVRRRVQIESAEAGSRIALNAQQQRLLLKEMQSIQEDVQNKHKQGKLLDKDVQYYTKKLQHQFTQDEIKNKQKDQELKNQKMGTIGKFVGDALKTAIKVGAAIMVP